MYTFFSASYNPVINTETASDIAVASEAVYTPNEVVETPNSVKPKRVVKTPARKWKSKDSTTPSSRKRKKTDDHPLQSEQGKINHFCLTLFLFYWFD